MGRGAERAGGGQGDSRGRGQQKDRVGVLHRPNALPHDSQGRSPTLPPGDVSPAPQVMADATHLSLLHPALAPGSTLSGGRAGGLCVMSPRGTLPPPSLPPTPEKQEPTGHSPPLAAPLQCCWIPTAPRASLGRHLLPLPWRPGGAWTSPAGG